MMTWRNGILFAILIFKSGHVTSIISVRLPPCKSNLHHTTEQHNTNRFPSQRKGVYEGTLNEYYFFISLKLLEFARVARFFLLLYNDTFKYVFTLDELTF